MIQQLYDYADQNGGRLKERVFFILDEFVNIGRIPDFDKKISTSRSRGISFSVILQNLDQLEAVYEKSYETIMGNCDTHIFLGSNSFKTVEYFSKALGEKTIDRDSVSVSRDKQRHKTGTSTSDQVMARALMTPDELRRMDNDECIIFEKGLKPIKAKKYYYFQKPMAKEMQRFEISHNDIRETQRGPWRKYNPYNPYVPEDSEEEKGSQDLNIESLDDLFNDDLENDEQKVEEKQENNKKNIIEDKAEGKEADAPILPLDDNENNDDETYDLQKELEAKFDELFGPADNDENNNNNN